MTNPRCDPNPGSLTDAINRGEIDKFLTKPWEDAELIHAVREAFRHYVETIDSSR